MVATHPDGTTHKWVEYPSMEAVGRQSYKANPKMIICPKCNKKGRINGYNRYHEGSSGFYYVIVHEKIDGKWGKGKHKINRRRRCYIHKEHRDIILKKLKRYISHEKPTI